MAFVFWNPRTRLASAIWAIIPSQSVYKFKRLSFLYFIFISLSVAAQQPNNTGVTQVSGRITDALSGAPLPFIRISFTGSSYGTSSDNQGNYLLSAPGSFNQVSFSSMGYMPESRKINPGQINNVSVKLRYAENQLKEVKITSGKKSRYRNKGNPAVELIQQVIDHKERNRMQSSTYLQYDLYERIGLSVFNLSNKFLNGRFFSKYKFMLDTSSKINGRTQTSLPVFFSEKMFQNYYRKDPSKSIQVLNAQKQTNILKFIDTAGLDIYLNRLYGNNIDIYSNNIFIVNHQFLSPISNHAPDFYKFFITDTVKTSTEKLIEISFTPRNKGDLLFEGKLYVTMDGNYAVKSCELNVNKEINVNFMRSLRVQQDFKQDSGRYFLIKSNVKADFGILKDKGMAVLGERTAVFSNYKLNTPQPDTFYDGKSEQVAANSNQTDTGYWARHRPDTLTRQQATVYAHVTRLENMPSFKRTTWIASVLTGGYGNFGPVQLGPLGSTFSYDSQEGPRLQVGGRTTPQFNKTIYLEDHIAYGFRDKQVKYNLNTYFSLNKVSPFRYPSNYFKVSYRYDADLPGQSQTVIPEQAALTSFSTGKTDYWLYNKTYTVAYVRDFENHFSFNIALRNWNQQPAGTLEFRSNNADNHLIHDLTTSEVELNLRYAPHEQIIQGTQVRHTIHSRYPILNLQLSHAFKDVLNGSYTYNNITANIYKRFYLSQLGYSDITLLGSVTTGKVPFPLLSILRANQSIAYDPDAYNRMNYLEFVSDHYAGLNITHSFNGFILNKIPLIRHLKWREYLSFKVLYGGLRNENNPLFSKDLYQFPVASNGSNGTFPLGDTPYMEGGAGIGNIFKFIRIDVIKRFNYLDHPAVSPYGVKLSFSPHL
ncbi:CarboxypepD_reg-like domain-containing protein [Mucilaginibacter sp. OK268]|uniref:DUF5686 family protein n=1 Tax=Mucilaginibacter sp. OK268 TaxID=1881048 RepID=UPI000882CC21|nr:DUF5686 family protein [Mucilaginibacter sp. OK268]SDQ00876.1 CarboxypepD_reg-like domain-containing protein [Mucilaginibacter sp. OK268]